MLPPFYYKGVSDEGVFRSVAEAYIESATIGCGSISTTFRRSRWSASADADRAADQGLSRHRRRHQGQLRRLEQHAGDARGLRPQASTSTPAARPSCCRTLRAAARAASPRRPTSTAARSLHRLVLARVGRGRPAGRARPGARDLPEPADDRGDEGGDRGRLRRRGLVAACVRRWSSSTPRPVAGSMSTSTRSVTCGRRSTRSGVPWVGCRFPAPNQRDVVHFPIGGSDASAVTLPRNIPEGPTRSARSSSG